MITRQSIEVFVKYDGSSDAFAHAATREEQALLSLDVALRIEDIILHLALTRAGAASSSYAAETLHLTSNVDPSGLLLLNNFLASGRAHGVAWA